MINKEHRLLVTVVTRNRPQNLDKFLNLIQKQTLFPDEILVVDNDSDTETYEVVKKHIHQNALIKYHNTKYNGGSAGGQSIALTYAISNDFDVVYTLDDDCEPTETALENVYAKWKMQPDRHNVVLSGISLSLHDDTFSFALWDIPKNIFSNGNTAYWQLNQIPASKIEHGIFWGWSHFFLGVLIPVDVIKRIGSVNTKYFIRGDELEYFIRLKESGVKLGAVVDSIVRHPKESMINQSKINDIKTYYTIRNNTDIRLTYYPSFKYNYIFYKLWGFIYKITHQNKGIVYYAVMDAVNQNFNRTPDDVNKLLNK